MKNLDYSKSIIPKKYKCNKCHATACKLWRGYCDFQPELLCANCAAKNQEIDISTIDAQGLFDGTSCRRSNASDETVVLGKGARDKTDQIGWYVPAIPIDTNAIAYWGYTAAPDAAVKWWQHLPTRAIAPVRVTRGVRRKTSKR